MYGGSDGTMRATAAVTRRHHGLTGVGVVILMVASMSPAFAGAGAGPSTSTTAPSSSTTSTSTSSTSTSTSTSSTTAPPTTDEPVYAASTTLGVDDPADFLPSSTTTTPPRTVVMHVTITTSVNYDFGAADPGSQEPAERPTSTVAAERVVFRGPGTTESPGASTTTTEPIGPVSRTQDSATLAAATSPVTTGSGASLFWPLILGVCCLLLLGGPVVARRLRHPH